MIKYDFIPDTNTNNIILSDEFTEFLANIRHFINNNNKLIII